MIKIAFPEWDNPIIKQALKEYNEEIKAGSDSKSANLTCIEPVSCENLSAGCAAVKAGVADALIVGIDYTSREVILACRDIIGMKSKTFSASFWMKGGDFDGKSEFVIGDAAACKNPTEDQLFDIVLQTYQTAKRLLADEPKVAVLSFSTLGSGGKDPSIVRAQKVIKRVRAEHPEIIIDGEMQLDAAINPRVAAKKAPDSEVAGRANVLILPDLNSGNILYKAMEQFGGMTAAGPLLQGFNAPVSDLSRGSTVADVKLVIEAIGKLVEKVDNGDK